MVILCDSAENAGIYGTSTGSPPIVRSYRGASAPRIVTPLVLLAPKPPGASREPVEPVTSQVQSPAGISEGSVATGAL